jgi:cytochrome c biogenesis protein CcmG/thiol:disulfide interchange protein DsbE
VKHLARWTALGVGVVVVAFAVVLATQVGNDPTAASKTSQLAGKVVPKFTVQALDGQPVTAANLQGKTTIVNFWNTWCIPCREEHPALTEFYAKHADDQNFMMVGIVRDDTKGAVRRWQRNRGDAWTIATDPGGQAALAFGTRGQPETFAISADGLVVGYQYGPTSVDDLDALLAAARGGAGS